MTYKNFLINNFRAHIPLYSNRVFFNFFNISDFIKNILIYGGYLPALWGPSLNITTSLIFNLPLDFRILIISFLLPLIAYNYDYYKDLEIDAETNPERANFLNKKRSKQLNILYIALMVVLLIWVFKLALMVFVMVLMVLSLLYNSILKGFTKKIAAFKNLYLAFMWGSWGTFLIVLYQISLFDISLIYLFLYICTKVMANTMFFDIKDIKSDKKAGLKTMPVILGKNGTIVFLKGLNVLTLFILVSGVLFKFLHPLSLSLAIFNGYTLFYLKISYGNIDILSSKSYIADLEAIFYPCTLWIIKSLLVW